MTAIIYTEISNNFKQHFLDTMTCSESQFRCATNELAVLYEHILYMYLEKQSLKLPHNRIRQFHVSLLQLASAVRYLHDRNVAHLDIKSDNIMVDRSFHVTLIDFGMAERFDRGEVFAHRVGAAGHAPPEVLSQRPYHAPPVDVFALGVTLYFAQFGCYPFTSDAAAELAVFAITWPENCSIRKCSVDVRYAQSIVLLTSV